MLVEPSAGIAGAHGGENLARLCRHGLDGVQTVVVTAGGLHADVATTVRTAADRVAEDPGSTGRWPRTCMRVAGWLERLRAVLKRRFPDRWWADQPRLVARFLVEVACLRTARVVAAGPGTVVVILTANEVLPATTRLVSGVEHIRVVHELTTRHGPWFRVIDRLAARLVEPPLVLCPTEGVRRVVRREAPAVPTAVQTFAVSGTSADSASAGRALRAELGLDGSTPLLGLFGGWWPYKDHEVVVTAVEHLDRELRLLVVGEPVDEELVARLRRRLGESLVRLAPVPSDRYSALCAAVDAMVISRRPGVDKESGLLLDAVRHGTPVVMSDHDPELVARVGDRPWVHLFATGDAESLRARLAALPAPPEHRPGPTDAAALGMRSAEDAVSSFFRWAGADSDVE